MSDACRNQYATLYEKLPIPSKQQKNPAGKDKCDKKQTQGSEKARQRKAGAVEQNMQIFRQGKTKPRGKVTKQQ